MENTQQNFTMLYCSCDKYEDAWEPFFRLLRIQWPEFDAPVLLNTESKSYAFPGLDIRTLSLYPSGEAVTWGRRMVDHLQRIDTEYVLLMLDDFFLCRKVDDARFRRCLQWLAQDPDAAVFSFYKVPGKNEPAPRYPGFVRRPQHGAYRFNCQASLWRTKDLLAFINSEESPWAWEVAGNYRSWRLRRSFYAADPACPLIFDYYGDGDWSGIMRGRWYTRYVGPLFARYGIDVDFTKRGTIGEEAVGALVAEQKKPLLYGLKTLYGNTLCVLKNPRSLRFERREGEPEVRKK
jgi:hypothetical protein